VPLENDNFQASAAKKFNILPLEIRNCNVFNDFKRTAKHTILKWQTKD
jgi:hypothetical protein